MQKAVRYKQVSSTERKKNRNDNAKKNDCIKDTRKKV